MQSLEKNRNKLSMCSCEKDTGRPSKGRQGSKKLMNHSFLTLPDFLVGIGSYDCQGVLALFFRGFLFSVNWDTVQIVMMITMSKPVALQKAVRIFNCRAGKSHAEDRILEVSLQNNAVLSCISLVCPRTANYVKGVLGVLSETSGLSKFSFLLKVSPSGRAHSRGHGSIPTIKQLNKTKQASFFQGISRICGKGCAAGCLPCFALRVCPGKV